MTPELQIKLESFSQEQDAILEPFGYAGLMEWFQDKTNDNYSRWRALYMMYRRGYIMVNEFQTFYYRLNPELKIQ